MSETIQTPVFTEQQIEAAWQILDWWAEGNQATITESRTKVVSALQFDHARLVTENAEMKAEVERLRAALCRKIPMFPIVREAGTEAKGDD